MESPAPHTGGKPREWFAAVGQSLFAERHVRPGVQPTPELAYSVCAERLRLVYLAAVKEWCP